MKTFLALAILTFGATAFAETAYDYKCFSYYWNGYDDKGTMTLTVSTESANADIVEMTWDEDLGGKRNPNYKSRGAIRFFKYGELVLEDVLATGGKTLKDGSLGGIARVEGEAEGGFYQYKFICKR